MEIDDYIKKLELLYIQVRDSHRKHQLLRFQGFKTTMGMDQYPNPYFSITNLFEPTSDSYSSTAIDGPCIAQGIFLTQDYKKLFMEDEVLRIYIEKSFKLFFK